MIYRTQKTKTLPMQLLPVMARSSAPPRTPNLLTHAQRFASNPDEVLDGCSLFVVTFKKEKVVSIFE
jgi:hypothetical protein